MLINDGRLTRPWPTTWVIGTLCLLINNSFYPITVSTKQLILGIRRMFDHITKYPSLISSFGFFKASPIDVIDLKRANVCESALSTDTTKMIMCFLFTSFSICSVGSIGSSLKPIKVCFFMLCCVFSILCRSLYQICICHITSISSVSYSYTDCQLETGRKITAAQPCEAKGRRKSRLTAFCEVASADRPGVAATCGKLASGQRGAFTGHSGATFGGRKNRLQIARGGRMIAKLAETFEKTQIPASRPILRNQVEVPYALDSALNGGDQLMVNTNMTSDNNSKVPALPRHSQGKSEVSIRVPSESPEAGPRRCPYHNDVICHLCLAIGVEW